ncbi:MAG: hypothetical protein JKZ00_07235 [Flavobacteriaceae bacterium]|nr:hypothetical protein [Flavobacteriaceae bacterium]
MTQDISLIDSFIIAFALTIPLLYIFYKFIQKRKIYRIEIRKKLTNKLTLAIENNAITKLDDFIDFILGYENYDHLSLNIPFEYYDILATAKHNISIKNYNNFKQENLLSNVNNILEEINQVIKEHSKREPFFNVPTTERNLLIDILEISKLEGDKEFKTKLINLGELIKAKDEMYIKLGQENNESLKIAKRSQILAFVFFITSIGLTIYSIIK